MTTRKHLSRCLAGFGLLLSTALSWANPIADTVFLGESIYTANKQAPWAQAVAIKDGAIIYVGNREGVNVYTNAQTKKHVLGRKMLLPGFIDTHAHPVLAAAAMNLLALDPADDLAGIYAKVEAYASENPEMGFIMGTGFNANLFATQTPTSVMLDTAVADRPVFLMDDGGHLGWGNTKAFEIAGVTASTPDPVPGAHYYVRDTQGNPTGYMYEEATFGPFVELGQEQGVAEIESNTPEILALMSSVGITSVFDASMEWFLEGGLSILKSNETANLLPIRVVASLTADPLTPTQDIIEQYATLQQTYSSDRLNVGAIKIGLDGTIEGESAALLHEYLHGGSGALNWDPESFSQTVVALDKAGADIHIHAIGDRAVNTALNAVQSAREANGFHGTRHTICHTQMVQDSDIARFKALEVIAQTTPAWHADSPDLPWNQISEQEREKLFPFNSIVETGAHVTFGSDFPYGGGIEALVPLFNIEVGATRLWPGNTNGVPLPNGNERLDVQTLINGYTIDAAYQLRMEDKIGSIEVGKRADLVVLDKNIFTTPLTAIHQLNVKMTMVDGQVVYTRPYLQGPSPF